MFFILVGSQLQHRIMRNSSPLEVEPEYLGVAGSNPDGTILSNMCWDRRIERMISQTRAYKKTEAQTNELPRRLWREY